MRYLKFFSVFVFLILLSVTTIVNLKAADSDLPAREPVSGWFTFTNTAQLRGDTLYWGYPSDEIDGYPAVSGTEYYISFSFTLAYSVIDPVEVDAVGNNLSYSLASGMVITDLGNDLMRLEYIFVNPGVEVYTKRVTVYSGGWINENYKSILINRGTYLPLDFINFLQLNGTYNFIPQQNTSSITDLIITYVDIPTRIMHSMLDISVMGSTLFVIVVGIITIVFVVYLLKRLL